MAILTDGHSTTIVFSLAPSIPIKHKTTTPPGMSAGGENDTTVMENVRWRTKQPKKLVTLTDAGAKVSYDPIWYSTLLLIIGVNQLCSTVMPNGDEIQFWGWLDEVTPDECQEGQQPTATMKVIASNQDDEGNEVEPVHVPAS